MSKEIWKKNFSIRKCGFHMLAPAVDDLYEYQDSTVDEKFIDEIIFIQEGDDCKAAYFLAKQLRKVIDETLKIIKENPEKIDRIHKDTYEYCDQYVNLAKKISKINFKEITTEELVDIFKELNFYQKIHHGYSICTTWFVDSDGEDFSNYLLKLTENIINKNKKDVNLAQVFSDMTTPDKLTKAMEEESESLEILKDIIDDEKVKEIFAEEDTKHILKVVENKNKKLYDKIVAHYEKWKWMPFTYIGPAYEISFYLEVWKNLIKQNFNYNKRIEEIGLYGKTAEKIKLNHINNLSINDEEIKLYKIASDIIHLKAHRKDCIFYGMYVLDMLLREIAHRLNLSLEQVRFITYWEMPEALVSGAFDEEELDKRMKFSVLYKRGDKNYIYTGEEARKFISDIDIEEEKKISLDNLTGTCACVGKATGIVKIVNLPEEMDKMNEGDVMVAHTTFPSLVPAMKKASAIVTDDGGITCHAAIVAREMKKPCVVGTRGATQVLHDGDLVEVDANKGIVKILK